MNKLQEIALNAIYAVDYDIGKECDPDVNNYCPELIDEVAANLKEYIKDEFLE